MSQTGSDLPGSNGEIDDPGREPRGLGGPPRNPLGAGPDQDSGRGEPSGNPGTAGESTMPEEPGGGTDHARTGSDDG